MGKNTYRNLYEALYYKRNIIIIIYTTIVFYLQLPT